MYTSAMVGGAIAGGLRGVALGAALNQKAVYGLAGAGIGAVGGAASHAVGRGIGRLAAPTVGAPKTTRKKK
jgi:outer membrane lipoprotein SlyB